MWGSGPSKRREDLRSLGQHGRQMWQIELGHYKQLVITCEETQNKLEGMNESCPIHCLECIQRECPESCECYDQGSNPSKTVQRYGQWQRGCYDGPNRDCPWFLLQVHHQNATNDDDKKWDRCYYNTRDLPEEEFCVRLEFGIPYDEMNGSEHQSECRGAKHCACLNWVTRFAWPKHGHLDFLV